ncbi:LuxR C-terminal-related transcriptional regulator [Streptomyces sp. NPDC059590]|uniref:helix-turn-helix transcriptional regulator n=1 Tax=Streptomyces sp. NPDC059590 TaxID=3346877 RepID=UPI0036BA9312
MVHANEKLLRDFMGRQAEMRLLRRARHDSTDRLPARYAVTGEAGIGRTSLLRAFAITSRHKGCAVVDLVCTEQRHYIPWALLDDLVGGFADCLPPGCEQGVELHDIYKKLSQGPVPDGAVPRVWGAEIAVAVQNVVSQLTVKAPLVITIDDADRADALSLSFLRCVVEACSHLPVMLVASVQNGVPAAAPSELAELLVGAQQMHLGGLSEQETAALVRSRLPRPPGTGFADACRRLTAGNPFMLVELVRWVRDTVRDTGGVPDPEVLDTAVLPAVAEVVTRRLNRIDPRAGRLAEAIAIAGDGGADIPLIAHLAGTGLGDTLTAADLLVRMGLVADDNTLLLRHSLVRNALVGGMTLMARNAAHLAAATYLHERRAPAERVAAHLIASAVPLDGSWPAGVLLQAARSALAADDTDTALRCLEHAAQVASGDEHRQAVLGIADIRIRADRARGLDAAVATLAGTTDEVVRARLLERVGSALYGVDSPEERQRVLDATAVAVAGTEVAHWPRLHRIAWHLYDRLPGLTSELLDELIASRPDPLADADGTDGLRTAASAVAALCRHLTDEAPESAVGQARRALGRPGDELCLHPLARAAALTVLVDNGHHEEAAARLGDDDQAGLRPRPLYRVLLLPVAARIALARGRLDIAREQLSECLRELARHGVGPGSPARVAALAALADVLISQGENDRARMLLRRYRCWGDLPPSWHYRDVLMARARLLAADGDLPGAARDLAELHARNKGAGLRVAVTASWRTHGAILLHQVGRSDEALELAREQLRFAHRAGSPQERGRALRALSRVSGGPRGERLLRAAARLLKAEGSELDLAYCLADLGPSLTRRNRPDEAIAVLTQAIGLAGRCGARPLVERGRQLLALADDRAPRHSSLRGVLALTARERQILIDAARGLTNERIATALRITRRTVELHLSSAYRKLGITGRRDFPEMFRDPGLWPLLTEGAPVARQSAPADPGRCVSEPPCPPFGLVPGVLRHRAAMRDPRAGHHHERTHPAVCASCLGDSPISGGS